MNTSQLTEEQAHTLVIELSNRFGWTGVNYDRRSIQIEQAKGMTTDTDTITETEFAVIRDSRDWYDAIPEIAARWAGEYLPSIERHPGGFTVNTGLGEARHYTSDGSQIDNPISSQLAN